jgi:hypothetical protein
VALQLDGPGAYHTGPSRCSLAAVLVHDVVLLLVPSLRKALFLLGFLPVRAP